jgi:hypothetical protein
MRFSTVCQTVALFHFQVAVFHVLEFQLPPVSAGSLGQATSSAHRHSNKTDTRFDMGFLSRRIGLALVPITGMNKAYGCPVTRRYASGKPVSDAILEGREWEMVRVMTGDATDLRCATQPFITPLKAA